MAQRRSERAMLSSTRRRFSIVLTATVAWIVFAASPVLGQRGAADASDASATRGRRSMSVALEPAGTSAVGRLFQIAFGGVLAVIGVAWLGRVRARREDR